MSRRKSIRNKLFLPFAAILSVIVFGFSITLFAVLVYTYSDTMMNNQIELTSQMISRIDSFCSEMDTIAQVAAGDPRLLSYFIDLADKDEPGNYFEQNLIDGVDASSLLTNINGQSHVADRVSVYNEKGDYVSTGILYETKRENGHGHHSSELAGIAAGNGFHVVGPHADFWSDSPESLISVIRPLSNRFGGDSYGVVQVQRLFSHLEALLSFETQQWLIMVVFDEAGAPIYSTVPGWIDSDGYGEAIAVDAPNGIQALTAPSNGAAVYGRSPISQWSVMLMYEENALYQTYRVAFTVLIVSTLLVLAALLALVYYLSDRLSRPIRKLSASIRNIDLQNLRLDISGLGQGEIDDIQLAFASFVSRLSQSATLELEAHMFALQSQINPHFLYNSLALISAAGYEQGNEEIADICARLSSMLRYAASHSKLNVTLSDEIENVTAYLELMKKRFEEDFTYEVAVDGEPSVVGVPKLILQPIVENCFQHGFKGEAPWHIDVAVKVAGAHWEVVIEDNGCGIPQQASDDIAARLEGYRQSGNYPILSPGGAGIINTGVRLFLAYGANSVFMIGNRLARETGARVVIGGSI